MNKKERVLNAFNNKPVDKVPVGFWFHFPLDMDLKKDCVKAHLDYYNISDIDFIKIMCDGFFDYPNEILPQIKTASDWKKMKPLGKDHPFIEEQVERAKQIVDGVHGECCVFYNVFCPMSFFRFATSDELLMKHLREDAEAVMYAFDVIAKDAALLSELLITEAGCDGIYYCVQNGELDRFTYDEYRKYVTPSDLYVLNHANKFSSNNILHCCGWAGDKNRIEVWQDYPAKVFNWAVFVENMDLAEGKKFFGGKCVLGGFDNTPEGLLCSGGKKEIEDFTEELIQKSGKIGVIIGADCSLSREFDKQRASWVVEKAKTL
jgi:uroporphyrinogen decarboxylase